jgi:putative addiction module CopG family antidote
MTIDVSISITRQMEGQVRKMVDSGQYTSASEVFQVALRLLVRQERLREAKKKASEKLPQEALDAADYLRSRIIGLKPDHRLSNDYYWKTQRMRWAMEMDRAHRIDGRSWSRIRMAIIMATEDAFWRQNIQSAEKLRKHFDTLESLNKRQKNQRVKDMCNSKTKLHSWKAEEFIKKHGKA